MTLNIFFNWSQDKFKLRVYDVVTILGFHPGGQGSIPGNGKYILFKLPFVSNHMIFKYKTG